MSEVMESNNVEIIGVYFCIDCDPYQQRPEVYARKVFEKLGVKESEPVSKLFGAWQWNVDKKLSESEWVEFKDWMKVEMDALYTQGKIRGAQWDKRVPFNDDTAGEV